MSNRLLNIKQQEKISRMCEGAVGKRISINMRGGAIRKNWIVVSAQFAGWRERVRSEVAQFELVIENPPCSLKRVQKTVVVESFRSLHD